MPAWIERRSRSMCISPSVAPMPQAIAAMPQSAAMKRAILVGRNRDQLGGFARVRLRCDHPRGEREQRCEDHAHARKRLAEVT